MDLRRGARAHCLRTAWRDIGYVTPRSWIRSLLLGITFFGAGFGEEHV